MKRSEQQLAFDSLRTIVGEIRSWSILREARGPQSPHNNHCWSWQRSLTKKIPHIGVDRVRHSRIVVTEVRKNRELDRESVAGE